MHFKEKHSTLIAKLSNFQSNYGLDAKEIFDNNDKADAFYVLHTRAILKTRMMITTVNFKNVKLQIRLQPIMMLSLIVRRSAMTTPFLTLKYYTPPCSDLPRESKRAM